MLQLDLRALLPIIGLIQHLFPEGLSGAKKEKSYCSERTIGNNWHETSVFTQIRVVRTKISKLNAKSLGVKYRLECLRTSMVNTGVKRPNSN